MDFVWRLSDAASLVSFNRLVRQKQDNHEGKKGPRLFQGVAKAKQGGGGGGGGGGGFQGAFSAETINNLTTATLSVRTKELGKRNY